MKLADKTCIVTGAASGIGRAAAVALAKAGARVCLGDFNAEGGRETAKAIDEAGHQALFVETDVSREEQCEALVAAAVEAFGGVDVLFNNAGINPLEGSVTDMDLADWRRVFSINVDGVLYCSRFAIPHMRAAGAGCIINTASPASFKGWPGNAAYIASKGAVMSLTRAMAMDLVKDNIRVNALVPGLILTGIGNDFIAAQDDPEAVASGNPMSRPGGPEEVAPMVVYLAAESHGFSTGAPFFVDGGELAGVA